MDVPAGSSIVRFGQFEADLRTGELRKGGLRVRLQDKPFRLLAALLERSGDVVTREELQRRLWPADTFVDFDNSLNNAVNRVRAALGDSAENPRFVEPVGRRGYRFVAPVDPTEPGGTPVTASPLAASAGRAVERPRARILIGGAVAAAVVLAGVVAFLGVRTRTVTGEAVSSLAVLPLTNDSAGSEDYFADGMTDALITELARLRSVRVISRTSVMGYRGTTKRLPEIARELDVDGIIEGSVLRSGDRIRITAQLVNARTDTHLWAETYHRDVRDILSLQSEVARAVANAVSATLTDASPLPPARPVDPAAFDLYLRGRSACTMRQPPATVRRGIDQLQQAIARDPEYAQAHAGRAQEREGARLPVDTVLTRVQFGYPPSTRMSPTIFVGGVHGSGKTTFRKELARLLGASHVSAIYVTIFRRTVDQYRLIRLLEDWGFAHHGTKNGDELVYVRDFTPRVDASDPR